MNRISPNSVIAVLIANMCSTISAAISVALCVYFLDPKEYADWIALSTIAFVVGPMGTSTQVTAVRRTVVNKFEFGDHLRQIWKPLGWTTLLIFPIGSVISELFDLPLVGVYSTLLMLPGGMLQGTLFGWLQGRLQFFRLMLIAIIVGVVRPIAVYIAFSNGSDSINNGALYQAVASIGVICLVSMIARIRRGAGIRLSPISKESVFTKQLLIFTLMTGLTSTDVLASRLLLADSELAQYATGALLSKAIIIVPMALTSVVLPKMFDATQDFDRRLKQFFGFLSISTILIYLAFVAVGKMGISAFFDLSPTTAFQFALLGLALAVIAHIGYEGIAKFPFMTMIVMLLAVVGLAGGLVLGQPGTVSTLTLSYLVASMMAVIFLTVGIRKSLRTLNYKDLIL